MQQAVPQTSLKIIPKMLIPGKYFSSLIEKPLGFSPSSPFFSPFLIESLPPHPYERLIYPPIIPQNPLSGIPKD